MDALLGLLFLIDQENKMGSRNVTPSVTDEPGIVSKDMAVALGYSNPRKALSNDVNKEDKNTVTIRDGIRGNPNMTVKGVTFRYSLILSSELP